MSKQVLMPDALTADNGAKAALSGEFFEEIEVIDEDGQEYADKMFVSWTTIKAIYRRAVELLGADLEEHDAEVRQREQDRVIAEMIELTDGRECVYAAAASLRGEDGGQLRRDLGLEEVKP